VYFSDLFNDDHYDDYEDDDYNDDDDDDDDDDYDNNNNSFFLSPTPFYLTSFRRRGLFSCDHTQSHSYSP
jgi:hypothetical protein